MANFEQLKPFDPKKMGNKKGYCLQNVAKGFGAYPSSNPSGSAKADMQANKNRGTFHAGVADIPSNCAVPIYIQSSSQYGHIEVWDKGVYWNDGKKTNNPGKILGWGEWCNGFQIVKKSSRKSFLPAKGYWCKYDQDERVAALARFMRREFPAYTPAKALGPIYGDALSASIMRFQKNTGLYPDGMTGPLTYKKLQSYGFVY